MVDSRDQFEKWWQDNGPITATKHDARVVWKAAIEECAAAIQGMHDNLPPGLQIGINAPISYLLRCCVETVRALKGKE